MSPGSKNRAAFGEKRNLAGKSGTLWQRARIVQAIRSFFMERGYLEIETPSLIPAPAPERHIDLVTAGDLLLHPSPELCMKRLLAAGYPKLFQICKVYRGHERGERHLPEFTLLEWYRSGLDYRALMEECEEMLPFVAHAVGLGDTISYGGGQIHLKSPWMRMTLEEAFRRYAPCTLSESLDSKRFDEIMVAVIEPQLGREQPLFLCEYPASMASLARLKQGNPTVAERFELYIGGLELANAFSELVDPVEQRKRFEREQAERERHGKPVYPLPHKFLSALDHLAPSAGIALGVDRLVMLLTGKTEIDEVVSFAPEDL
jgi:lysyl-tRNA synthetase class 2